jgi:hypothetical protein
VTGHRRASGKPLAHTATTRRRNDHTRAKLTAATTPVQLVTAALDHARAVLTNTPPATAGPLAERITSLVLSETRACEGGIRR